MSPLLPQPALTAVVAGGPGGLPAGRAREDHGAGGRGGVGVGGNSEDHLGRGVPGAKVRCAMVKSDMI